MIDQRVFDDPDYGRVTAYRFWDREGHRCTFYDYPGRWPT